MTLDDLRRLFKDERVIKPARPGSGEPGRSERGDELKRSTIMGLLMLLAGLTLVEGGPRPFDGSRRSFSFARAPAEQARTSPRPDDARAGGGAFGGLALVLPPEEDKEPEPRRPPPSAPAGTTTPEAPWSDAIRTAAAPAGGASLDADPAAGAAPARAVERRKLRSLVEMKKGALYAGRPFSGLSGQAPPPEDAAMAGLPGNLTLGGGAGAQDASLRGLGELSPAEPAAGDGAPAEQGTPAMGRAGSAMSLAASARGRRGRAFAQKVRSDASGRRSRKR